MPARFAAEKDGFSVEVPEDFKDFVRQEVPGDPKPMTIYKSTAAASGYMVMIMDFGTGALAAPQTRALLNAARMGLAVRGEVRSQSESKIGGLFALVLRDKIKAGEQSVYSETYFAYADGKVYRVSFLSTDEADLDGPEARGFFQSFRLTGAAAA